MKGHHMSTKAKKRNKIVKLIEDAIVLYLMFACVWCVGYLVSEILTKLGVAG